MDLTDAIAYYRVSTERQAEEGHTFEDYLRAFKSMGFQDHQIYCDIDSGGNDDRLGYNEVLRAIAKGIKRVYVPDFTRFSRSLLGFENAMKDFERAGATLITLSGGTFAFDNPDARMIARQHAIYAQWEREKIQWRTMNGMRIKRSKRQVSSVCFGYDRDGSDHVVRCKKEYRGSGISCFDFAKYLVKRFIEVESIPELIKETRARFPADKAYSQKKNPPLDFPVHSKDVKGYFVNPQLRGHVFYSCTNELILNQHEPIVTPDQWIQIQDILSRNKIYRTKPSDITNPYVGLLFCACGGEMFCKNGSKTYKGKVYDLNYIVCRNAKIYLKQNNLKLKNLPECHRRSAYGLRLESLDDLVIKTLIQKREEIAKGIGDELLSKDKSSEEIELEKQIAYYELLATQDPDVIPIVETKRQKLLSVQAKQNKHDPSVQAIKEQFLLISQDPDFWKLYTPSEKSLIYREFIKSIICDCGKVTIKFKI